MSLAEAAPMLKGVRVIDLTSVVFGPLTTQILADMGAEVIKIEPKSGDAFRYSGRSPNAKGMSPGHMALNRGKKSVVLDLKAEDDAAILRELITGADLFIHNVREAAIERLGFGYEAVKDLNPDLIYVHCVGFGSDGPYAGLQAYDDVIQAATGTTSLASRVDGNPRPRYIPSLIADKVAGLNGAYAALAAIIHKLRTGRGQFVEVPMFEAFANFMLKEHLAGLTFDPPVGSVCYPRQIDPDRQPFQTADGWVTVVPYTPDTWDALYAALGISHLLKDERFATPKARQRNMDQLYQGVAEHMRYKTTDEWCEILRKINIPCMPVRAIDDILDDPHLQAVSFFKRREHPTEGAYYEMREASRFSDWQPETPSHPATIGEHTKEVSKN